MWEDLEVLQGDPLQKWQDIIFHANRNLAQKSLDMLLERVAIYEKIVQEANLEEKLSIIQRQMRMDQALQEEIRVKKVDIAIESMSKILGENE